MTSDIWEPVMRPDQLFPTLCARLSAGDLEGVVALYEPDAMLELADGLVRGRTQIREWYRRALKEIDPTFAGTARPTRQSAGVALTSAVLGDGSITAEVARQQADGSWLWTVDCPQFAL